MQPIQRINVAAAIIAHVASTKLATLAVTKDGTTYRDHYTLTDMHRLAIAAGHMTAEQVAEAEAGAVGA